MKKNFVLTFILVFFFVFFPNCNVAYMYFETDFFCSFNNTQLIITQTTHSGWRNCLDFIAYLKSKRTEISKQIDLVKEDSDYNKSAKSKLIKQRSEIDALYNKSVQWVIDLENKIFQSYKKKYNTKIKQIRSKLITKQAILATDLLVSIREWERELVWKISKTIGFNFLRIKLIEWIISSKNLDEMIPLLNTYESIITEYIEWKLE